MINLSNPAHMFLVCLFVLVLIAWSAWGFTADGDGSFFRCMPPIYVALVATILLLQSLWLMVESQLSAPPASAQQAASVPEKQEGPSD